MTEVSVVVRDNGSVVCLDTKDTQCFRDMGNVTTRRASHVVPIDNKLRAIFYFLRKLFGEKGWMAEFTRLWPCRWLIDLRPVGGPIMAPYRNRKNAIRAEVRWLNEHLE